jgi:hypothetical protein
MKIADRTQKQRFCTSAQLVELALLTGIPIDQLQVSN